MPPVVERLMEEGENKKRRLEEKKRKYRAIEMSENKRAPDINKKTQRVKIKPIYERYPEILR